MAFTSEREELQHFLNMRHNISTLSKIYGTEPIPGQFLNPSSFDVVMPVELRRFLCEWYAILYEKEQEEILGFMNLTMIQHARLQICAEIFGSMISSQRKKMRSYLQNEEHSMMNQLIYTQMRFNITLNIRLDFLKSQKHIFWRM